MSVDCQITHLQDLHHSHHTHHSHTHTTHHTHTGQSEGDQGDEEGEGGVTDSEGYLPDHPTPKTAQQLHPEVQGSQEDYSQLRH